MNTETEASNHFYIYPIYFDSEQSCANGRRVPLHAAHKSPRVEDLLMAVKSCGFGFELEKNKSHPKSWTSLSGRIKVILNEKLSKNQLLLNVSSKIKINPIPDILPCTKVSTEKNTKTVTEVFPNLIIKSRSKKKTRNNK